MTLYSLSVARCTSARPFREAPGTSSTVHFPDIVSHPPSGLAKSNMSSGPADWAKQFPTDTDAPKAVVVTNWRLEILIIVIPPHAQACHRPDAASDTPDTRSKTSTTLRNAPSSSFP